MYDENYIDENFNFDEEVQISNYSGRTKGQPAGIFKEQKTGRKVYAKGKRAQATITVQVFANDRDEMNVELFNTRNSVARVPQSSNDLLGLNPGNVLVPYRPFSDPLVQSDLLIRLTTISGSALPYPVSGYNQKGDLVFVDCFNNTGTLITVEDLFNYMNGLVPSSEPQIVDAKISMSGVEGLTYRRFIETLGTSALYINTVKFTTTKPELFQKEVALKEYGLFTSAEVDSFSFAVANSETINDPSTRTYDASNLQTDNGKGMPFTANANFRMVIPFPKESKTSILMFVEKSFDHSLGVDA
ncbi:MAG: hypothetical protein ACRCZ9_03135 [Fusobacteriaceae bacterium]